VVALAVMTGLMLIARPANEGSVAVEGDNALPRALTVVRVSSDEPPPSSPVRAWRSPRGARATTVAARPLPVGEKLQAP
jgi:hypothetical protein